MRMILWNAKIIISLGFLFYLGALMLSDAGVICLPFETSLPIITAVYHGIYESLTFCKGKGSNKQK
jgi:hypothetical protein